MHNRIHLLEQEERRALKRIDETRSKADQILQIRHDQLQYKKCLDSVRQAELQERQAKIRQRNEANMSETGCYQGQALIAR